MFRFSLRFGKDAGSLLFSSPPLGPGEMPVRLNLLSAHVQPNGRVWLRYEVSHVQIPFRQRDPPRGILATVRSRDEVTVIRSMTAADLYFAASCTAAEGWVSEGRLEFEGFFSHDPGGCLIAEVAGRRVGIGVATSYGEYGFIGELIVVEGMRGCGIGRMLLDGCVGYLRQHGAQSILLDGVLHAVPLYERAGFRKVCRSLRFSGTVTGKTSVSVRPMRVEDMLAVAQLDRQAFGADRGYFLSRRLSLYPDLCKVLEIGGRLAGFISGRRGTGPESSWTAAGPWVVAPGVEHPQDLLQSLPVEGASLLLSLGILETNLAALSLVRCLGFVERPDSPWRMLLGRPGNLGDTPMAYAVGTAAIG